MSDGVSSVPDGVTVSIEELEWVSLEVEGLFSCSCLFMRPSRTSIRALSDSASFQSSREGSSMVDFLRSLFLGLPSMLGSFRFP